MTSCTTRTGSASTCCIRRNLDIAKIFSSNATAAGRFAAGDWRADAEGMPYLADAQANLFCRKEQEINYGSHTIFIGRVLQALTREDVSPLVYRDGRYGAVTPDTASVKWEIRRVSSRSRARGAGGARRAAARAARPARMRAAALLQALAQRLEHARSAWSASPAARFL